MFTFDTLHLPANHSAGLFEVASQALAGALMLNATPLRLEGAVLAMGTTDQRPVLTSGISSKLKELFPAEAFSLPGQPSKTLLEIVSGQ